MEQQSDVTRSSSNVTSPTESPHIGQKLLVRCCRALDLGSSGGPGPLLPCLGTQTCCQAATKARLGPLLEPLCRDKALGLALQGTLVQRDTFPDAESAGALSVTAPYIEVSGEQGKSH